MRKDIINIVGEIVDSIDKNVIIRKIENADLSSVKLFYECSLKWLKEGDVIFYIKDEETREATVTEIGDGFIIVLKTEPDYVWESNYFTISNPIYYFKGTPLATNSEFQVKDLNEDFKTPFIWLVEPTDELFHENDNSTLERESELRIFFCDKTNFEEFTVQQHHDNVIKYLNDWVDGFMEVIKKDTADFGKLKTFKAKNVSFLANETPKGYEKNIIDSNLSAVDVRFTLPIRKGAKCLC